MSSWASNTKSTHLSAPRLTVPGNNMSYLFISCSLTLFSTITGFNLRSILGSGSLFGLRDTRWVGVCTDRALGKRTCRINAVLNFNRMEHSLSQICHEATRRERVVGISLDAGSKFPFPFPISYFRMKFTGNTHTSSSPRTEELSRKSMVPIGEMHCI